MTLGGFQLEAHPFGDDIDTSLISVCLQSILSACNKEHYNKFLQCNLQFQHERLVYVFDGEDEHQKVAHIQYDNK